MVRISQKTVLRSSGFRQTSAFSSYVTNRHSRCLIALILSACAAHPAVGAIAGNQRETDAGPIEEIIVTATRREAPAQSVPLSIYVVGEDELQRLGANAFSDYGHTVPGLSFTDGGTGGEKQTFRGISTNTWFEVNSGTAIYLDEVPLTHTAATSGPPFNPDPVLVDVDRIEVLRGPQGTLFGASAMGGVIRIVTRKPNTSEREAGIQATATSTKNGELGYGLQGVINVPTENERAAFRLAGYHRNLGGVIDNIGAGKNDVDDRKLAGFRLSGSLDVSETVNLQGRIAYQDRDSGGFNNEEPQAGSKRQDRTKERVEDEWANYNLVANVDLGWATLLSSTSYLDRTINTQADVSPFLDVFFAISNPLNVVNDVQTDEFVQEVRLVSEGGNRLEWLAGAFYQDQDTSVDQDFPSPGFDSLTGGLASLFGPADNLFVRREKTTLEQLAAYGDLTYEVLDRLHMSAGMRWYDIDRHFSSDNTGLLFVMGQIRENASASESGVTPRFTMSYLADDLTLYASASKGFRPGGVNPPDGSTEPSCVADLADLGLDEFPGSYDSDSLWNYELGAKWQSAEGRLRFAAAAFHIDWDDLQTMKFLNCGTGFTENAGKAESNGAEINLNARVTANLDLALAASYTEAELTEDVPNLGGSDGDRVPGVPKFTASVGLSYYLPLARDGELSIHGNVQHVGGSYTEFDKTASRRLSAFTLTSFRTQMRMGRWVGTLFVNNVFDQNGTLFVNQNILGEWTTPTRPRTVGVSLSLSL